MLFNFVIFTHLKSRLDINFVIFLCSKMTVYCNISSVIGYIINLPFSLAMSRYCLRGRWYSLKPNSRLRYDSGSESEPEKGKDAKKVDESKIETGSNSDAIPPNETFSKSKVVEQKTKQSTRKNLNL